MREMRRFPRNRNGARTAQDTRPNGHLWAAAPHAWPARRSIAAIGTGSQSGR